MINNSMMRNRSYTGKKNVHTQKVSIPANLPKTWKEYIDILRSAPKMDEFGATKRLDVLLTKMTLQAAGTHNIKESEVLSIILAPYILADQREEIKKLLLEVGKIHYLDKLSLNEEILKATYNICSKQTAPKYRRRELIPWLVDEFETEA